MTRRYDRRPGWRASVLATAALTPNTKLVLLVMLDQMDPHGKVRYPVRDIARELGIRNFRRVSDRITEAHRAGYLITVTRAVHGRLAEYQATFPSDLETGSLESWSEVPANRVTGNRVTTPGIAGNRVTPITETPQPGTFGNEQQQQRARCDWCSDRGCPQCVEVA